MSSIFILADIIKRELDLADGRVLIYNQKLVLPNVQGLFVWLSYNSSRVYGVNYELESQDITLSEKGTVSFIENISVNIMSRNMEAFNRKEEVVLALNSNYSRRQQEINDIKIANIPNVFIDISEVETSARLNRYQINFDVYSKKTKSRDVEFFDKFNFDLITNR